MDQMNSTDYGYTPEQIKEMQAAFKSNDITRAVAITPDVDMPLLTLKLYNKVREIISQYWLANLKEFGIKRLMRNFSRDYPVKLLQNADGDYISEQLYNLFNDPERYKKAFERFFEMYEQPICAGLEGYASSVGKDVENLTDEEINYVIDKVADVINEELVKVMMLGQQVPELFSIGKKNPEEKDFHIDEDICNFDLINFYDIMDKDVKGKVSLHSLRHTFATRCIEAGMQPKVLQHILGHSDISITLNTYCDAFENFQNENIAKTDEYLAGMGICFEPSIPIKEVS